jgi:hypothetical protein
MIPAANTAQNESPTRGATTKGTRNDALNWIARTRRRRR